MLSLPSRERGLKYDLDAVDKLCRESLPSRERGLKFRNDFLCFAPPIVAPLAGAWIEMGNRSSAESLRSVAPLAGAWIEIEQEAQSRTAKHVAPLAGAWIEIDTLISFLENIEVAPLAGAWIEIVCGNVVDIIPTSLPSRERGLKLGDGGVAAKTAASLPSRERGLKWNPIIPALFPLNVAPLAGAWIEISHRCVCHGGRIGRSPRGSVD